MNPMIRKELRQRMRERRGWVLPSLYLVALGIVIAFAYHLITYEGRYRGVQGWELGLGMFLTAAYAQLALLVLMTPILSAGSLTIEKEQRTLAGLLTSLLSVGAIWWGKFVASLMFLLLLLVAGIPVLSMCFAFGGVGPWEVFMAVATTILVLATMSAIGIYWSSVFRRSVHATAVSYVTAVVFSVVTAIISFIMLSSRNFANWDSTPAYVKAPFYFNPFFFLTMGFARAEELYPEWVTCAGVFILMGCIAILLTLRNLRRGGEGI